MEFRSLGSSGLKVPALCFGTATFGGGSEFFRAWGNTDVKDLDAASEIAPSYPAWHLREFQQRNPLPPAYVGSSA